VVRQLVAEFMTKLQSVSEQVSAQPAYTNIYTLLLYYTAK